MVILNIWIWSVCDKILLGMMRGLLLDFLPRWRGMSKTFFGLQVVDSAIVEKRCCCLSLKLTKIDKWYSILVPMQQCTEWWSTENVSVSALFLLKYLSIFMAQLKENLMHGTWIRKCPHLLFTFHKCDKQLGYVKVGFVSPKMCMKIICW